MNLGLRILLLHWVLIGCASTPKPTVKKKAGAAAPLAKGGKGPAGARPSVKAPAPVPGATPATAPLAEEEEVHEEDDDQYSRIKKYYKK